MGENESLYIQKEKAKNETLEDNSQGGKIVVTRDTGVGIQYGDGIAAPMRIPGWANILRVKVVDVDRDHWRVSVQNIGLDWIDEVSFTVEVYNVQGLQYRLNLSAVNVKQFLPWTFGDYAKDWKMIVVSNIVGRDEGDIGRLADITYSR